MCMASNRESKPKGQIPLSVHLLEQYYQLLVGCNRAIVGSALVLVMRDFDLLCVFQWYAAGTVTTGGSVCHQMSASAGMGGAAPLVRQVSGWQRLILPFAGQNPCGSPTIQHSVWESCLKN